MKSFKIGSSSSNSMLSYPIPSDEKVEGSPSTKRKLQIGRTRSNNSVLEQTLLPQTRSGILPEVIGVDSKQKSRNKKRFSVIAENLSVITARPGSRIKTEKEEKEKEKEKEREKEETKVEGEKKEEVKGVWGGVSQGSKRRAEEMVRDLRVFLLQSSWTPLLSREKKGKQLLLLPKHFRLSKTLREIEYSDSTDSDHVHLERIPISSIISIQTEWKEPPKSKKDKKHAQIENPPPFSFTLFLCLDEGAVTVSSTAQPHHQQQQQQPQQPQQQPQQAQGQVGEKGSGSNIANKSIVGSELANSKALHLAAENHEDFLVWLDTLRGLIFGPNYMELPETVQEIQSLLEVEKELQQIAFEQRLYCPHVPDPPLDFEFVT